MILEQFGNRIVRSWPGPGTSGADTFYETEDGRIWTSDPARVAACYGSSGTAGCSCGRIVDGRIVG